MKKFVIFFVLVFVLNSVSERLNKKKLRENTKEINLLEHSNYLLMAENRQVQSEVNRLTQLYKQKLVANNDLDMILPKKILYAKVNSEEVNLVFVFTDKI